MNNRAHRCTFMPGVNRCNSADFGESSGKNMRENAGELKSRARGQAELMVDSKEVGRHAHQSS